MKAEKPKLLFVCSMNQWRSPTAEKVYQDDSRISVRSAGTASNAVRKLKHNDIDWADAIIVMENEHRRRIVAKFPIAGRHASIYVIDVPDDYPFMDRELVEMLTDAVEPIIAQLLTRAESGDV